MTTKVRLRIRTNGWAPKRAKTADEAKRSLERALRKFLKRHDVRVLRGAKFRARKRFVVRGRPYFSVASDVRGVMAVRHFEDDRPRFVRDCVKRWLEDQAIDRASLRNYIWSSTGFSVSVRP